MNTVRPGGRALLAVGAIGLGSLGLAFVAQAVIGPAQTLAPAAEFALAGQAIQGGWMRGVAPAGTLALTLNGQAVALAPDGGFLIAFDRDAGAGATLLARFGDGRTVAARLAIAGRAWAIERINLARHPLALPDMEFQRRRAAELARIEAARAMPTDAQGWRQRFIFPVRARISGLFGAQRIYRGEPAAYHSGLDLAGGGGTEYVAPADGVVVLAAQTPFTLEGNLLIIDHGMGLSSAFLHSSQLLVSQGQKVSQGQVLGRIGMTGRATGPHLHWSIKWREARLDPLLFVNGQLLQAHNSPSR